MTTRVADHPGFLQSARNHGDARAPDVLLLGERQFIAAMKVGRPQQPP